MTAPDHHYYVAHKDCDSVYVIRDAQGQQVGGSGLVLFDAKHAADFVEALNWAHAMQSAPNWRKEDHVRGKGNE